MDKPNVLKSLRKKPKQRRSLDIIDTILEASAQVFNRIGFEKSTTNKIAKLAGVSIGSLYQFFPNKDAILATWIEKNNEEHRKIVHAILAESKKTSPEEDIENLINKLTDIFLEKKTFLRMLFQYVWTLGKVDDWLIARAEAKNIIRDHLLATYPQHFPSLEELDRKLFIALNGFMGTIQIVVMSDRDMISKDILKSELSCMVKKYLM